MAAGEAPMVQAAARASLWLQPHRIVMLAIALGLVLAAIFFMRWDWLPQYYEMGLIGIWRSLWILAVTCILGFLFAVPLGLAQATGSFWFAAPVGKCHQDKIVRFRDWVRAEAVLSCLAARPYLSRVVCCPPAPAEQWPARPTATTSTPSRRSAPISRWPKSTASTSARWPSPSASPNRS